MEDAEIIERAVAKALQNGWNELDTVHLRSELKCYGLGWNEVMAVIFSHSFARAFFGETKICKDGTTRDQYLEQCAEAGMTEEEARDEWDYDEECVTCPAWEYHLSKMVLCEKPLRYLERHLK